MACFLVPMGAGIVTTALRKKIPKEWKPSWLNRMLWGGVIMLAVEHLAHEEITIYPPFLTAMKNPSDIPVMLHEMAIIGSAMTIAIFLAWGIMVYLYHILKAKARIKVKA